MAQEQTKLPKFNGGKNSFHKRSKSNTKIQQKIYVIGQSHEDESFRSLLPDIFAAFSPDNWIFCFETLPSSIDRNFLDEKIIEITKKFESTYKLTPEEVGCLITAKKTINDPSLIKKLVDNGLSGDKLETFKRDIWDIRRMHMKRDVLFYANKNNLRLIPIDSAKSVDAYSAIKTEFNNERMQEEARDKMIGIINEMREEYMCEKTFSTLEKNPSKNVVIIGGGHLPGMKKIFDQNSDYQTNALCMMSSSSIYLNQSSENPYREEISAKITDAGISLVEPAAGLISIQSFTRNLSVNATNTKSSGSSLGSKITEI